VRPLRRGGVCERADSSTTTRVARIARRATRSARRSRRARVRHSRASPLTPSAKETPRAWAGVLTRRRADRGASRVFTTGGSTVSKPTPNTSAAATSGCRCRPMAVTVAPTVRRARPVSVARGDRMPGAPPPESVAATRAGPPSHGLTCTSHCGRATSTSESNRRRRLGVRADRRDVEPGWSTATEPPGSQWPLAHPSRRRPSHRRSSRRPRRPSRRHPSHRPSHRRRPSRHVIRVINAPLSEKNS
jgi:hypothetical protein